MDQTPNHAADAYAVIDWLDTQPLMPREVRASLTRCLNELERYDRGLVREFPGGDYEAELDKVIAHDTVRKMPAVETFARESCEEHEQP